MAGITDPAERKLFENVLSEWNGTQGIQWLQLARQHLEDIGVSAREAGRRMYEYVKAGGKIDKVPETRENWKHLHKFHYDLRLDIGGDTESYLEMRLITESRLQPPCLLVVNAKPR
jgi:hypothetical protein